MKKCFFYFAVLFLFGTSCSHPPSEKPNLQPEKFLPEFEKIRAQLNADFDPAAKIELNVAKDNVYSGPADSLVHYTISVPKPDHYYSICINMKYFSNTNKAVNDFKNDYADFKKRNSGEGMLDPEVHYRMGNCTMEINYGCALSKTNTQKMLNSLLEGWYKENEKNNSWFENYCGGGNNHSQDMQ